MTAMDELPRRLAGRPSWLVGRLAAYSARLVSAGFAAAGAHGYHYRILAALAEFGPASQAQLGRHARMDRSDVVAAVNALVDQGLVDRAPDPDHGRRNRVTLTEEGDRRLRRLDRALDQVQDDLLGPLPPADRVALTRLLDRLVEHHERD
jgi:MarR family transcriptional regulator, lower aerobic nicotinate degradation pathway regulator